MQISVPLKDGLLADEYGKYAPSAAMLAGYPIKSFPITIKEVPTGTKSFAIVFIDFDSTPVCGFTWIHWLAANIPATLTNILAGASRQLADRFVQGRNSNAGALVNGNPQIAQGYVGPQPPDKIHDYTLTVYALDTNLPLKNGYWLNEFLHVARGHILDRAKMDIPSRAWERRDRMETRIFFNPGDSIANIHDYNEAVRQGQIFKRERHSDDLVIAKGPGDEEYAIFYAKDAVKNPGKGQKPYDVKNTL